MYRTFGLGVAAIAALGFSLATTPSASAFHGGSNGSHGGFFGGSHGGSFGGLFSRHRGSSGSYGSHGGSSNSCDCDCNSANEAYSSHDDGDHEDRDHVSYRSDDRSVDAPSRDVRGESNTVIVNERDRDNRRRESTHVDGDHRNDRSADRDRDNDKKDNHDKNTKKDESKDRDKDSEKKDDSKK